jgi:hypothetical protein
LLVIYKEKAQIRGTIDLWSMSLWREQSEIKKGEQI